GGLHAARRRGIQGEGSVVRGDGGEAPVHLMTGPGERAQDEAGQEDGSYEPSGAEPKLAVVGEGDEDAQEGEGHDRGDHLAVARDGLKLPVGARRPTREGQPLREEGQRVDGGGG